MIVVTIDASGAVIIPAAAQEAERHRIALVAALHLPPETTWEEALARVVPVPAEPVGAKGCHGCAQDLVGRGCRSPIDIGVWCRAHLGPDLMTPKPGAPECPGRVPKEQG